MSRKSLRNLFKTKDDKADLVEYFSSSEDMDGEDFDEDDNFDDPDFMCSEDEFLIDDCLQNNLNSTELLMDPEVASLNFSSFASLPSTSAAALATLQSNSSSVVSDGVTPRSRKRKRNSNCFELEQEEDGPDPDISTTGQFIGPFNCMRNDAQEFRSIMWKKKNLQVHVNEIIFRGEKELPNDVKALKTPFDFFQYFLTDDFYQHLVDQMNLYACQQKIEARFVTNKQEIRQFIGIMMFMSVYRYPNVRSYWGRHSFEPIRNAMTRMRFEQIRQFLHFNDNSTMVHKGQPGYDKLHRIRPLINHFNERFGSIPMLHRLCVDEQMCATKMGGNPTRQYMPAKPHKWGTKLFVLCDSMGFSYACEIYSGAGDNVVPVNAPDLGASSNVVVRLSKHIPDDVNHIVYFDNFYTSIGLLTYLRSRGIYSLGTVRSNRVPNIKLSTEADLAKRKVERGYSEEYVANVNGIDISSVLWMDNKSVRLLSTYCGVKPFLSNMSNPGPSTSSRWDRKTKQKIEIDCPFIIKEYNRHMGGVDLMDGLLGRYHIRMKTRKWTNRIFFHLLDVAMVNAYILYHRSNKEVTIELPNFRSEVAETLCIISTDSKKPRGRPVSSPIPPPSKSKKSYFPTSEVRYDNVGHWCIFQDRNGKKTCKQPGCKSETQAYCTKCKINLCNSTSKSCFMTFHQR